MAETDRRPPLVVCDAGPLIHLDDLACLALLADFRDVLVPKNQPAPRRGAVVEEAPIPVVSLRSTTG